MEGWDADVVQYANTQNFSPRASETFAESTFMRCTLSEFKERACSKVQ